MNALDEGREAFEAFCKQHPEGHFADFGADFKVHLVRNWREGEAACGRKLDGAELRPVSVYAPLFESLCAACGSEYL